MKAWKLLTLCAGISLLALSLTILLVGASLNPEPEGFIGYKHYYIYLSRSGSPGDCYNSERYVNVQLLATGLASATPQPYSIAVGYVVDPTKWGSAVYTVLHSPGWGPAATYGSYYAIWGNFGSTAENIDGVTYVIWN